MEDITGVDKRLRNSFKAVRRDMEDLKRGLNRRLSDIEELRRSIDEKIKDPVNKEALERFKKEIEKLQKSIEGITKDSINKEELERVKTEVKEKIWEIKEEVRKCVPLGKDIAGHKIIELLIKERAKDIGNIKKSSVGEMDIRRMKRTIYELEDYVEVLEDKFNKKMSDFERKIAYKLWEISSLKDDLEITKSEIVTSDYFRKQVKELDKSINELRSLVEDVEQRSTSKDELKESVEEIKREFAKVQRKTNDVYGSAVTSTYFDQQISRIDAEINWLRETVENSREGAIKDVDLNRIVGQLNAKIGAVRLELEKLGDYVSKEEFNSKVSLINQQEDKISKLEKKFRDAVATNTALYKELRRVNEAIDEDRRLDIDRIKLEKKIRAYKDEKIETFRGTLLYIFLGLLSFTVVMYFYMLRSPMVFPGLGGKISLVVIVLIVLLIIIFLPYKKIMPIVEKGLYWFKRGVRVKKKEKVKEKVIKPTIKEEGLFKKIKKVVESLFREGEAKLIRKKVKKVKVEEAPKLVMEKKSEIEYVKKGISFVFQVSLLLFLITLIVKEFKEITFINLTYFLIFVVIFGILHSIFPTCKEKTGGRTNYFMVALLSLIGAVFIYSKIRQLGWLAWIIAIVSGILIAMLSAMFLEEEKEGVNEKKIVNNFFKDGKGKVAKKKFLFRRKSNR
jgi:FtsH-binding integral membrane protein